MTGKHTSEDAWQRWHRLENEAYAKAEAAELQLHPVDEKIIRMIFRARPLVRPAEDKAA